MQYHYYVGAIIMTKIYFGYRRNGTHHGAKMVTDAFFTRSEAADALLEYKGTSKSLANFYKTWKEGLCASSRATAGRKWKDLNNSFSIWERDLHGINRTVTLEAA
tara:strand:+ start:174 stop:488 length:315 start_codon:yes stop_codon:yes gene_type:complete